MPRNADDELAISTFKKFLQFNTISNEGPKGSYRECIKWLRGVTEELGLISTEVEFVEHKPVFIATWPGLDPDQKSVLLNCHYDVVPVDRACWTVDPFEAIERENGDIVARGSQDMKCVGMWYLSAVRRLIAQKRRLKRTVHLCFVPDEEIGGKDGMVKLVGSDLFAKLNIAVALDEGLASITQEYPVYYAERSVWWLMITASGPAGHGSTFAKNTATEKLARVITHLMEYRKAEEAKLTSDPTLLLGDVTTINITAIRSGASDKFPFENINVIPTQAHCAVDCRIAPTEDLKELETRLRDVWTGEDGVSVKFVNKEWSGKPTSINADENPFWGCMQTVFNKMEMKIKPMVFPAATDGRYLRAEGIPVFGFSPMINTPVLLHDHDEYLNANTFLRGIGIYEQLISELANHV